MEKLNVLIDGIQKEVYGIFYIYNSKYYFVYTEKEVDENGYVVLYMTQVGKETASTPNGPVDTGYMIGVEISDPNEQKVAQESISYIVEDKKNNTQNSKIQYLPMSMLVNFKVLSKKRFRLLKSIIVDNFKLEFEEDINNNNLVDTSTAEVSEIVPKPIEPALDIEQTAVSVETVPVTESLEQLEQPSIEPENTISLDNSITSENIVEPVVEEQNIDTVIVDYRTRFFEEEEKNKELQAQIDVLTQKLNDIKNIIE